MTGYTLGGGLSWLGRKYGWACNNVSAIELVAADGEPRTVDANSDPDLFWALRGGGGGYAIVTALHVNLFPVAEAYAGGLLFPPDVTADGLRRYRDWTAEASEEVGSMVRMLNLPPIPDIPEEIAGKKWLAIMACCIGSKEEGEKLIAPLREIGEPAMDAFDQIPARAQPDRDGSGAACAGPRPPRDGQRAARRGARCVRRGRRTRRRTRHCCWRSFATSAGRLRARLENAGALDKLDAEYVMLGIGMLMDPAMREPIEGQLDKLHDGAQPVGRGRRVLQLRGAFV